MSYFVINNERGKNQYENLGQIRPRTTLRPMFSLLILGFCTIFFMLSSWNFHSIIDENNRHVYYLNLKRPLLHRLSDKFLSFGIDTSLLRDMENLPIKSDKFINLARQLSPAYVRIGGTSSDCLFLNETKQMDNQKLLSPVDNDDISNFTITEEDLENLYNFATKAELRMIFDLNVLIRHANNSWDDSNARRIISFAAKKNMSLDWQLGNEPNSFHHVFDRTVTATQLADDYIQLRQLLNNEGYSDSILVGPEVNHIGDASQRGETYAEIFLRNAKDSINYLTWHQYYLNGREATVKDFINYTVFNYLPSEIESLKLAIESSGIQISTWLSETSTAFGGGAPELSDRFVAGFLWLDKLGYSASAGLNVVTRQSFFGGNYAMIGPDLLPNPDWWVSVVYKRFVSEKVLNLTTTNNMGHVRFYAHCTPKKALINGVPAVTLYGVNLFDSDVKIVIQGFFNNYDKKNRIFVYSLTSDNLQSRNIKMNNKVLSLQPNGDLPPFKPIVLKPMDTIILQPYSMTFLVLHGAELPDCEI